MRRIRRWYAEQWAEPEDGEPVCIDGTLPPDAGMSTVEYAVGTVVAAALAAAQITTSLLR
jgi:hypothetical protein